MKKASLYITLFLFGQFALGQNTPIGIDTTVITNIGGIQQVIKLKGKDISKPYCCIYTAQLEIIFL